MLAHGADPNKPNNRGETPLDLPAQRGHHETVALLRLYGANVNEPENLTKLALRTLLKHAAAKGEDQVAQVATMCLPEDVLAKPAFQELLKKHADIATSGGMVFPDDLITYAEEMVASAAKVAAAVAQAQAVARETVAAVAQAQAVARETVAAAAEAAAAAAAPAPAPRPNSCCNIM